MHPVVPWVSHFIASTSGTGNKSWRRWTGQVGEYANISKLDLHKVPWILNDFDMCYLYNTFGQEFVSAIEGVDGLPWIEAQFQKFLSQPGGFEHTWGLECSFIQKRMPLNMEGSLVPAFLWQHIFRGVQHPVAYDNGILWRHKACFPMDSQRC